MANGTGELPMLLDFMIERAEKRANQARSEIEVKVGAAQVAARSKEEVFFTLWRDLREARAQMGQRPVPTKIVLSEGARILLNMMLGTEVDRVFMYSPTRQKAMEWARGIDEIAAQAGLLSPLMNTSVEEWAAGLRWPDDPDGVPGVAAGLRRPL